MLSLREIQSMHSDGMFHQAVVNCTRSAESDLMYKGFVTGLYIDVNSCDVSL